MATKMPNVALPKCGACLNDIIDTNFVECAFENCRKSYHHDLCIGGPIPDEDQKLNWVCPQCRCAMKRAGGSNCSTPVRAFDSVDKLNITFHKRPTISHTNDTDMITYDRFEALLDTRLEAIKASLTEEFNSSVIKWQSELKEDLRDLKSRLQELETQNEKLKTDLEECKLRQNILPPDNADLQDAIT